MCPPDDESAVNERSTPSRREAIASLGAALVLPASGCLSGEGAGESEGRSPEETPTPDTDTPTARDAPTEARNCSTVGVAGTRTPASHPDLAAEDALPEPADGWEHVETTHSNAQFERFVADSARGTYTGPDGGDFVVDVFMKQVGDRFDPGHASRYPEIGWDVGVVYGRFLFVAGTGTYRLTHTPEKPPRLDRTPGAESEDRSRELLSRSPILTGDWIARNGVSCGD
jgi:hypothetical protein